MIRTFTSVVRSYNIGSTRRGDREMTNIEAQNLIEALVRRGYSRERARQLAIRFTY